MIINTAGSADEWQAYLHFASVDTGHLSTVVSEVTLSREVEDSSEQQTGALTSREDQILASLVRPSATAQCY